MAIVRAHGSTDQRNEPVVFKPVFESPSGGKLPGTATHTHLCRACSLYVPCGETACGVNDDRHNLPWAMCCVCELPGVVAMGQSVEIQGSQIVFGARVVLHQTNGQAGQAGKVVLGETSVYTGLVMGRGAAMWMAHELAKELLRQAGIDPAKGRWG